jgi:hypothetical protein
VWTFLGLKLERFINFSKTTPSEYQYVYFKTTFATQPPRLGRKGGEKFVVHCLFWITKLVSARISP